MTVTLESDIEDEVRRNAAAQGQEADEYVNRLIKTALRQSTPTIIRSTLTPEERRRLQQERVARAVACNQPASTSNFRREDIYDDEEGR